MSSRFADETEWGSTTSPEETWDIISWKYLSTSDGNGTKYHCTQVRLMQERTSKNFSCKLDERKLKVTTENKDLAVLTGCRMKRLFSSCYGAAAGGKPGWVQIHCHGKTPPNRGVSLFYPKHIVVLLLLNQPDVPSNLFPDLYKQRPIVSAELSVSS